MTTYCFVFASPKKIKENDSKILLDEVTFFLSQWKSHGMPVQASARIEKQHFLLIELLPGQEQPGGCSKDELFRFIKKTEEKFSYPFLDRTFLFLEDPHQNIHPVPVHEMDRWIKNHPDFSEWKWYNTTVLHLDDWKRNPVSVTNSFIADRWNLKTHV